MRIPVNIDYESRDGTSTRGARLANAYVEIEAQKPVLYKRPALAAIGTLGTGAGRGLFYEAAGTALYSIVGTALIKYGTATTTVGTFTQTELTMVSFAVTT